MLVSAEFATKIVLALVFWVVRVVFAVGAGLPHVEYGAGDGLVGVYIPDDAMEEGDLAVGRHVLDDAGTKLAEWRVGRPERSENCR